MATYDYDCIIIGGGAAGLTASGIAANFGSKTLMIEAEKPGGDCTWTGCVPSKTLIKAARVFHQSKNASRYGLDDLTPELDFKKLMDHVHQVRQHIYEDADAPELFEEMGVEVRKGTASFTDSHTVRIENGDADEQLVSGKYIFIATGARARKPAIEGIDEVDFLTNENLFELHELPERLIIVGAGPIGIEMGQTFRRLGSDVSIIDHSDQILSKEDTELSEMLAARLIEEGVELHLGRSIKNLDQSGDELLVLLEGEQESLRGSHLLFATGRSANINPLKPDKAGLKYSDQGISVNKYGQTNIPHIYAIGDVTGEFQLTHMSEQTAKVAVTHALLKVPSGIDRKYVPRVTFTDPELGHTGRTEKELKKDGTSFETYYFPYSKIDRALLEGESYGLVKIFAHKLTGKIYGASVLGAHAGELISEYTLAMKNGVSLKALADTIHPYPSWALGARRAADQWYIKNQSEWSVKLIKGVFGYRGEIPDLSDPDRVV